ncbi:antitoxin component YwqK of YwqJK toxin-antitoxin module [Saonia flava]|uniref:Antitoxin component YwqK of YwqJK toxin-antitoxin module n=1 Tax=Saonia flava TaxID=523696 RepID=A0A846QZS9_9FLAO|nr:nicotinic acid mononucleotide adenyltransferase [Saonia flava]NJB71693.1 antitoxin component YwqK of YwqJK toxin-antitoxin module [Saonia flava]
MKKAILFLAVIFSISTIYAQGEKPTFKKEGDLVKATYFHGNGEVAQMGYFLNGELHGEWKMFNEEGLKISSGEYLNGKKTGKWFFWKGEELQEVDFVDSRIVNVTKWNNSEPVVLNK